MTTDIVRIPFHGGDVLAVDVDGKPHVFLRPVIEQLGIDYSNQLKKLKAKSWATVVLSTTVAEDGKVREMVTVNMRTLMMLLATIDENRVAEHVRPVLIAYQSEVADVIEAYWTRGSATNRASEAITVVTTGVADPREQAALGALRVIKAMGDGISAETRESMMTHVWADYSGTAWQTQPLPEPSLQQSRSMNSAYVDEPDLVQEWVSQAGEPYGPGTQGSTLYAAFIEWCQERGIVDNQRPTMTHVGRRLTALGYPARRHHSLRYRPLRVARTIE